MEKTGFLITKKAQLVLSALLFVFSSLDATYASAIFRSSSHVALNGNRAFVVVATSLRNEFNFRGGGETTLVDDDDEEDDDSDVEEEEEESASSLSISALKALKKSDGRRKASTTADAKKAIDANLLQSTKVAARRPTTKQTKNRLTKKIPYIVRACLNPFTVIAMTKAYFASLFNVNYLQEDSSQTLRSALQEKAKKSGGGAGGKKSPRKMRPGQAKTLSDLPQLSA